MDERRMEGFNHLIEHTKARNWREIPRDLRDILADNLWRFLQIGALITATNFMMLVAVTIKTYGLDKILPLEIALPAMMIGVFIFSWWWVDKANMAYAMTKSQRIRSEPFTRLLKGQEEIIKRIENIEAKIP